MRKGLIAEHYPVLFLSTAVTCLTETSSSEVLPVQELRQHSDERCQKCQPALFIYLAAESVSINTGVRKQKDSGVIWTVKVSWLSDKAALSGSKDACHTFILARLN